ncbi:NERD domain-containing protein [Neobacillus drentensis]|uniref:nuclease-related domain-containing protein n=1 Tax=Neobacillus drentensis TaxID=220684 RepID=UPI001F33CE45|nr:nuclease-related domain-containing protein [Neobacillus drentensis]ULT55931.1 NERD domain-containing protein [Neobacillus drentensis]
MAYKPRTAPEDLKVLRILNNRLALTAEQHKYYLYKEKGFEGEVRFDLLTEQLQSDCLILNDLYLEVNNTSFQLDSSIIFQHIFYFFEIKNLEGDYCYREERFETNFGKIIKNPLDQIKRSSSLLLQLFQKLGFSQSIEAYVVFVNPEFFLYQAPMDKPIIYPPQLKALMKKLDNTPSKLTNRHKQMADKLISLHQVQSPYSNAKIPTYEYNQIRKDITCSVCHSFSCSIARGNVICVDCGHVESVESAVLRCVEEIRILFPNMRITTNVVFEWCGIIDSKKVVRRILKKNFKSIGERNLRYFE